MIYGIGTDVCSIARMRAVVARHGERFAQRVLGEDELREYARRLAKVEQRKASKAAPDARARAKLQRQVQHFVEFLQKEGIIADAK